MKIKDVLIEGSDYEISLVKLTGKKIKDITGYLSGELGETTFKLCNVIFEDNLECGVEGEHDFPYLVDYDEKNLKQETLDELNEEEDEDD